MHSFIDSSGCVFLNTYSGETLSVQFSEFELTTIIFSEQESGNAITSDVVIALVNKGFLKPIDVKDSDVE